MIFILISCTQQKTASQARNRVGTTDTPAVTTDDATVKTPGTQDNVGVPPNETKPPETTAPKPAALEEGSLNVQWIHGSANCNQNNDPPLQVHAYNKNLTILRQNKCLNFEGPFIYLIFGEQKALLIDTGATASATTFPIRQTVEGLLTEHYGAAKRAQIMLIVSHSHAHGDHRAADAQFVGQPATTVVGIGQAAVASFFGITNWPESIVDYDLGGRILKVIPIPGHEVSHVALYDAQTGILFTGDTLYPGRLYIQDWTIYRASVTRLRTFAEAKPISHVLGAHIEISKTPGQDYPAGSTFQADEHVLPLSKDALILLDNELKKIGAQPAPKVLDEFIISP